MSQIEGTHRIIHAGYFNDTLRKWQVRTTVLSADFLIFPVFVSPDPNAIEEIGSLPNQYRVGANKIKDYLQPLVELGLKTVLLFGIIDPAHKNETGSAILDPAKNPTIPVIQILREAFKDLTIACDVCLCSYTSHGHCGVLQENGAIDNLASIKCLAKAALAYALHGAHIVAPSDMMDGRVKAIVDILKINNMRNYVSVMSYSAKFASCFYGPFRDACDSAPGFGDRKCYQLPPGSAGLAKQAIVRDINEEADILMVKPGMPYLDIVKKIKDDHPEYPLAIYQVSGEYAMIWHAAKAGVFDLKKAVFESLEGMHRAGADILITYYTPLILKWLSKNSEQSH